MQGNTRNLKIIRPPRGCIKRSVILSLRRILLSEKCLYVEPSKILPSPAFAEAATRRQVRMTLIYYFRPFDTPSSPPLLKEERINRTD